MRPFCSHFWSNLRNFFCFVPPKEGSVWGEMPETFEEKLESSLNNHQQFYDLMIRKDFPNIQENLFTLEEYIDNKKFIPLMMDLDEEALVKMINRSNHLNLLEKQLLQDFLSYLILKSKIQNEDAIYETQNLQQMQFHQIIREQLNFSRQHLLYLEKTLGFLKNSYLWNLPLRWQVLQSRFDLYEYSFYCILSSILYFSAHIDQFTDQESIGLFYCIVKKFQQTNCSFLNFN